MRLISTILISMLTGCVSYSGVHEAVTFTSRDGTVLRGSLVFPETSAQVMPAVVLLHGAERASRSFVYRMHANIFLERGFAVLLYDKRGAGESGGVHKATFTQLIDDALAAIELLERRDKIDSSTIGIVSASESGWLVPEIVQRSGSIAFAINKVGPAVSWRDTVAWENYNDLQKDGVAEEDAKAEVDLLKRIWEQQVDPKPQRLRELERELGAWQRHPYSVLPRSLEVPNDVWVERISYDPTTFLEQLSVPMLYVYGSDDINVPTDLCVQRLRELEAKGKPVSFHVYQGAGHELGSPSLLPPFYRFEPGYEQLIGDFAVKHL